MKVSRVPSQFEVQHLAGSTFPEDDEWIALVRAPEGLTVVREVPSLADADSWVGFYAGSDAPDRSGSGALATLVGPLGEAGIAVFVASTHHADLVLVPRSREEEAAETLRGAGHTVTD